jgi:hypothetical protein
MITKVENNSYRQKYDNEELPPVSNYLIFIRQVLNSIKEPRDASEVIEAIYNLKRLIKIEIDLFIHIFDCVYEEFEKFLINENPDIAKASLYLTTEVLGITWVHPNIGDWVMYIIPLVINLSVNSDYLADNELKYLIEKCFENISKKCIYEETAHILLIDMTEENQIYTDRACDLFMKYFMSIDKFYLINAFEWNEMIDNILHLFHFGKEKRTIGTNIIRFLKNQIFTNEEWEEILAKLDSEYLEKLMMIDKFNYSTVYDKKKKMQASIKEYSN